MRKLFFVSITVYLTACAGFEKVGLYSGGADKDKPGTPVMSVEGGNLKKGLNWEAKDGKLEIGNGEENSVTLKRINASDKKTAYFASFEPMDFRGDISVSIQARSAQGEPTMKLVLIDNKGKIANGKDLTKKVVATDEYGTYVFRLNGAWLQVSPELADVDGSNITQMYLYVDYGNKGYAGTLEVASIEVKLDDEAYQPRIKGPKGKEGGMLADFNKGIKGWKSSGSGISISGNNDALIMSANDIGPFYQSASSDIKLVDLTNTCKLRVRAKVEGNETPYLRVDFIDVNGLVTNKWPVWIKLDGVGNGESSVSAEEASELNIDEEELIEAVDVSSTGERYVDYYLNLCGRFKQSYPKPQDLDASRIKGIKLYLNPGFMEYSGKVYIDEIEAIQ